MFLLKCVFYYKPSSNSPLPSSSWMETIHLIVKRFLFWQKFLFTIACFFSADITTFDVAHLFQSTHSLQNYLHSSRLKALQPQNACCGHFRSLLRFLGVHMWDFWKALGELTALWLPEPLTGCATWVLAYKSDGAATRVNGACEWLGLDLGVILNLELKGAFHRGTDLLCW